MMTLAGNVVVRPIHARGLTALNSELVPYRITGRPPIYIFPSYLIFHDLQLLAPGKESPQAMESRWLFVRFSFITLLKTRALEPVSITLSKSRIGYDQTSRFARDHAELLRSLWSRPATDVRWSVRDLHIDLGREGLSPEDLALDLSGGVKEQAVELTARIDSALARIPPKKIRTPSDPFSIELQGFWTSEGATFDHLVLQGRDMYVKLWGALLERRFQCNGFAFMSTALDREQVQPIPTFRTRIQNLAFHGGGRQRQDGLPGKSVFILDINTVAEVQYPEITIKHCAFTVDNVPVVLTGRLSASDPLALLLEGTVLPPAGAKRSNEKQADFLITGSIQQKTFFGEGMANLYFPAGKDSNVALEKISVSLPQMDAAFDELSRFRVRSKQLLCSYWTNGNEHRVTLDDVIASLNPVSRKLRFVQVNSGFYKGSLGGKIWVDTLQSPMRLTAQMAIQSAVAQDLNEILDHFTKLHGRLSGDIHFQNRPDLEIGGDLHINDGHIKNFQFFSWMASTFGLPSLNDIATDDIGTKFLVNGAGAQLNDIRIRSEQLSVEGFYHVAKDGLVSSKLSLDVHRGLAEESARLRSVLHVLPPEKPSLDFQFQLSGLQSSMNFQWLPSPTKEKIQEMIPDFIERIIERRIDASIAPSPAP